MQRQYYHDNIFLHIFIILTLLLEMQHCTQVYGRRPYGVGMLIAGYDVSISFIFCLCA